MVHISAPTRTCRIVPILELSRLDEILNSTLLIMTGKYIRNGETSIIEVHRNIILLNSCSTRNLCTFSTISINNTYSILLSSINGICLFCSITYKCTILIYIIGLYLIAALLGGIPTERTSLI